MATLAELEAELKSRETSDKESFSWSTARDAFLAGAKRGGYSVATLPALPGDIARQVAGQPSDIAQGASSYLTEENFPGYERYFRAGEGAGPGAAFGGGAGAVGGPAGIALGGLTGALFGGISNIAAKELFPSSPTAQTIIGLLTPAGVATSRARAGSVPSRIEKPTTSPETNIIETAGQKTGTPKTLIQEEQIRRSAAGGETASQFDVAQAASVDDFLTRIQKFSANPNLSVETISQGVYKAYDNFASQLQKKFKTQNTANFTAAKKAAGDGNIIPTSNVQQEIDNLIARYDNPEVLGSQAIVSSLKRIRSELTTTTKTGGIIVDEKGVPLIPERTSTTPDNISLERLQQNLSAWGDAAYKGTFVAPGRNVPEFADAAPGMIKGIARSVLGAFKRDLDLAADSGIQGAVKLQDARNSFRDNLQILNDYASKPLVKYFDQPSASALVPEEVVTKFINLPASQKADAAAVLKFARPELWESLRLQGLTSLLDPARVGEAAAAGSPKFDMGVALKQLGTLKDPDIQWLFPTKEEKNLFRAGLEQIQRIQRKSKFTDLDPVQFNQAARTAAEAAGALGGAVKKYGVQTIVDVYRLMAGSGDQQKIAYMMFNPNGRILVQELAKPNPNLRKIPQEAIDAVVLGTAAPALTAREVANPRQESLFIEGQEEQPLYNVEDLEEELRRREQEENLFNEE